VSKRNRHHKNTRVSSLVDVVVTTAGRFDMLRECLAALDKQTIPHTVYIVEIDTDPKEHEVNKDIFEGRRTERFSQNVGFPVGANSGARKGSSPLILFIGDDVTLFEGTLERMVERMKDETIGICGAKLIFPPNSTHPNRPAGKIQHVGLALNIRGEIIHPLVGWSPDHPKSLESRDVFATTGGCFMIRRSLFQKTGGFDPAFGLGTFEDVDLSIKVRTLGKRVFVDMDAKAYHYVGASAEKRQVAFPMQNNLNIFRQRWGGTPYFLWDEVTWY
jgi:GT2 family glycosyltransferase